MQIVGYRPVPEPALLFADGGPIERVRLTAGTRLAYSLGQRHCAGTIQNDHHIPCSASRTPRCRQHEDRFDESTLREREGEHAVYLAAFAPDTFKVGITRRDRLETRLREQGADRGAHLQTVPNGDIARDVEEEIGQEFTQRVRTQRKIDGLGDAVEMDAWNDALDAHDPIERFQFDHEFAIDTAPIPEQMATGTVLGVQGRVLVLERDETTYAVDLRTLVGYDVTAEPDTAERQASLGSFG